MYISMENLLATREWWTYGHVRKYLKPVKYMNEIEYYDYIDISIVETLERLELLKKKMKIDIIKKGGECHRIHNIINWIRVTIPEEIDIQKIIKKIKHHKKSVQHKYNNRISKKQNSKIAILAFIRHNYTNYEDIIYNQIDEIIKISSDIDKNNLIKKLKDNINNSLLYRFPEIKGNKGDKK